tara:strand:- start:228 stop:446 length:219 start_codon:yes stop_codon:yes gene_type:complete
MANANPTNLEVEDKYKSKEELMGYKPKPKPKPKPKSDEDYPIWPGRDKAESGITYMKQKSGNLIELGANEDW